MTDRLRRVRTALFTPGTEAARLRKAITSGADVCIFDLEDSVPAARIDEAREIVRKSLEELAGRARIWLRVHPASSREMAEDLRTMPLSTLEAVVLPKASHRDDVESCRRAMKQARVPAALPVVPIIESAAGVLGCAAIAEVTDVACLALGRFDLAADLGRPGKTLSGAALDQLAENRSSHTASRLGEHAGGLGEQLNACSDLIVADIRAALAAGRSPVVMTERKEHVATLADRLADAATHVVVLQGGMGVRQMRAATEALAAIPDTEARVLVATGRYLGEGFDDARLDTLFLTLPVSWLPPKPGSG